MENGSGGGGVRAILVGAGEQRHLHELGRLADTLGIEVVGVLEQSRLDGAGYVGKGKREELAGIVLQTAAELVITDDELTASQARVLERSCGASVVDRTELIIRIFEAHARDAASRLEVELADLEYRLPRVKGRNPALSRLGGGVGGGRVTRGPGEQQLEYDRRAIRRRIEAINKKLVDEGDARKVRRSRLKKGGPPVVALVGYTNAGKTTILNSVSGARRSTADRLFETLETTSRLVSLPAASSDGAARPDFVVTDTVGLIRKLPIQLVHSFAGTLEVARDADAVVLCADASSDTLSQEISTAVEVLTSLGLNSSEKNGRELPDKTILCLNKIDRLTPGELTTLRRRHPQAAFISALAQTHELLDHIYESISADRVRAELLIPHEDYRLASHLYGKAEIHDSTSTESGVWMDVTLPRHTESHYEPYKVSSKAKPEQSPNFR